MAWWQWRRLSWLKTLTLIRAMLDHPHAKRWIALSSIAAKSSPVMFAVAMTLCGGVCIAPEAPQLSSFGPSVGARCALFCPKIPTHPHLAQARFLPPVVVGRFDPRSFQHQPCLPTPYYYYSFFLERKKRMNSGGCAGSPRSSLVAIRLSPLFRK
jgi:hypothetical protein